MPFGISFGAKKTNTSSTTAIDKLENTLQTQSGTKVDSQTGTSDVSQTGTSAGQTASQQQQATQQTGEKTSTQAGTTKLFSDDVLASLNSIVSGLGGRVDAQGQTIDAATKALSQFDPNAFVSQSVDAASSKARQSLDELFGGLSDAAGSALGNNSMTALLAQRGSSDATSQIEGVRADATAKAQDVMRQNQLGAVGAAGSGVSALTALLEQLKGGTQATSTTGAESTQQATTGTTAATGTTAEQTAQQSNTTTTQQLVEALTQLLSGTTHTTGTENSKGSTLQFGGGLSASF